MKKLTVFLTDTSDYELKKLCQLWLNWVGHNNVKKVDINHEDSSITLHIAVTNPVSYEQTKNQLWLRGYKFTES